MKRLFTVLFLIVSAPLWAEGLVMGTVDMAKVLFYYDEVKILRMEISNRESRYQAELNQEENELKDLAKKLNEEKLGEADKEKLEKDYSRRMFNLQKKFEDYKKKLDDQKDTELEKVKEAVYKEIEKVAQAKKIDYVIDRKQIYFGEVVDFTDELIEKLNKKSPSAAKANVDPKAPKKAPRDTEE